MKGVDSSLVLQIQRIRLDGDPLVRPLYWRTRYAAPALAVAPTPQGGLRLQAGARVSFETYFNAVFERQWWTYTGVRRVLLRLDLVGQATIRVWRRASSDRPILLHESIIGGPTTIDLPKGTHFREAGLVWFELGGLDAPVTLQGGSWLAECTKVKHVSLGVVICTLDRDLQLGAVLSAIADDRGLCDVIGRVIVVNQGRPDLVDRLPSPALQLGERVTIIEQANYGGAGGFGRGMIEAMDDPAITHVCLLDDDVRLAPESLLRIGAFFATARDDLALGGHMLDSIQPMKLYEAGARVGANGALQPLCPGSDLTDRKVLRALLDHPALDYNGWWLFAVAKATLRRVGMPLPCFIRGDDVEFGLRLGAAGIATVVLPGIAIWHEPFYLKIGGWQLYYEVRNAFIAMALHQDFRSRHVALVAFKQLMTYLLTFRYGSAGLVIRGIQDFCRGPALLQAAPSILHAEIVALRSNYPEERTSAERVLADEYPRPAPHTKPGFMCAFARAVARNWLVPTRHDVAPKRLAARDLVWFRVTVADCVAVDTGWDLRLPTYRRDRASFRTLFRSGVAACWRLYRQAKSLRHEWQGAAPLLTSEPWWRTYLELAEPVCTPAISPHVNSASSDTSEEIDLARQE